MKVVDSKSVSMGCGLVAIAAAREAKAGASLEQVMQTVSQAILRTHIVGMIADIHYPARRPEAITTRSTPVPG